MTKRSEYEQLHDGEWFDVSGRLHIACCSCGHVHEYDIDWSRKRMRLHSNWRATAALRRHHEHPCVPVKRARKRASR